jgi:hypothetical protein
MLREEIVLMQDSIKTISSRSKVKFSTPSPLPYNTSIRRTNNVTPLAYARDAPLFAGDFLHYTRKLGA